MIWILLSLQLFVAASAQVNITEFTETSVTVSWSGQDYPNVTVQYGVLDNLSLSEEVSDGMLYTTIDSLQSAKLYTFRLQGYNKTGDLVFTSELIKQATRPYPVSNVTVSLASVTSLYITWEGSENTDVSYVVVYTDVVDTPPSPVSHSTNMTYINLTDLIAGHEYSIDVFSVANEIRSNGSKPIIDNTVPLPPESISVISVNESTFNVSWQSSTPQDSYSVSYKKAGESVETPVDCGQPSTQCIIVTSLGRPGDSYIISVRSVKGQRVSKPIIKQANTIPASLMELMVLNTTTTALKVMWKGIDGSPIDVYQVSITPADASQSSQNKTEGEVMTWFRGLEPGKTYQVTVVSITGTATSKPLDKIFWTVPVAPVISAVTTNVSIIVSWQVSIGQRDNFTLVIKEDNSGKTQSVTALGTAVQAPVTGLSPGHNYTVTVTAMAGNQQSPPSVLFAVTTVPNPVQELRIVVTDTDSAMISWTPPTPETLFDRYQLKVSQGATMGPPEYLPADLTSYNVTGLKAGTHYILHLTTLSGITESSVSSIALTTIPPSVESVIVSTETRSLTVSWDMPPETNFRSINITLSNSSGTVQTVIRSNSSDRPSIETFDNLAPGEVYLLSIITVISDGTEGRPSHTYAITKPDPVKEIRVNLTEPYYTLIEWELVPQAHGYLVIIVDTSEPEAQRHNQTETGSFANITDLHPGHHYNVSVQSFVNYTSELVYSTEVATNVTTKPLPVVSLELVVSPERITVKWKQSPPPGAHDRFIFLYRTVLRDSDATWTKKYTVNVQEDIPNPFPGEKYIVQVYSESGDQLSDVTEATVVIAPRPPKSLTVLKDLATTSSLFFKLEVDRNVTYAIGWNITFSSAISPERETAVTDPSSNVELSSLGPGETFTIKAFSITVDNIRSSLELQANGTVQPTFNMLFTEELTSNSSLSLRYTENPPVFDLYHFQLGSEPSFTKEKSEEQLVMFENLGAGQSYQIKSWVSSEGVNSIIKEYTFQTYPNKVKTSFDVHPTEILVSFSNPEGKVDSYSISCHGEITCGEYSKNATDAIQTVKFEALTPFQDYSFTINTRSGGKSVNETVSYQTKQTAPSIVRMVTALVVAPNTVAVRWKIPAQSNGEITLYTVKYVGKLTGKPDDETTKNLSTWEIPPTNLTIPGLLAGYLYTFSVQAYTLKYGPAGEITLAIPAYPPPFKESLKTEDILPMQEEPPTSNSVKLKFVNAFSEKGGEVITYTVIVSADNRTEQKTPLLLPGWLTAKNDPAIKAYQAVGNCSNFFSKNNDCQSSTREKRNTESVEFVSFTVGSELDCDKSQKTYCNGPLKADTDYYIALRAFTAGGPSDTPYSKKIRTSTVQVESSDGAIIGGVVGSLLILALLLAVFIVWRKKQARPNMYKKEAHEMNEDTNMKRSSSRRTRASRIVKLIDFPEHVQLMSADSDYRFAEEFEELREVGRDQSCNAAELPQNRAKNRFTNILPYDHSRVKLLPTDDEEGSDYINANYMPGYHSRRQYLVTQGPLPSTRDDFWRMLWEQNVCNIIMLTRCVEKGREKCDHYWPQNAESMFYGDLQVAILNETKFPDWTVTEFRISLGDNGRKIRHFHYTGWPDFGVPERPQSLVKFVKTVQTKLISDGGPQIVHCSAGVGRSGTYIALDRLLQHIQHNDWVDPYSIVHEMRCQRVWMVQTEQQYICIHQCLLSVLQGLDEEPIYCNHAHENIGYEDDEGINVEIM